MELGALPQEITPRVIREWASNVPTNPSGRHGPRPDADADDAASQFEFGTMATVPPGPNQIIPRGFLRPSRAAFVRRARVANRPLSGVHIQM